jgi:hypothetical protein
VRGFAIQADGPVARDHIGVRGFAPFGPSRWVLWAAQLGRTSYMTHLFGSLCVFAACLAAITAGCRAPEPLGQGDVSVPAVSGGTTLNAGERKRVIDAVTTDVKRYYFARDIAQKIADTLLAHEKAEDYRAVTKGEAFADLLTAEMRSVSQDMHLMVVYSDDQFPDRPPGPPPGAIARYREAMKQSHCMFEKVQVLAQNIGYFKLNAFPDPAICRADATAAMARLNHVDALIFDLRDNGGGYGDMVSLIAAYLFDHPEYMYSPRGDTTAQSWTQSPVPGNLLADKPVYVLTSARTFSGAEQFSYDLKMLKRATLVGERTRGGAHAGVFHRIDEHFGVGIPENRPINPYAKTDWEGTGVEPDVKVRAADALATAEKMAKSKLRQANPRR